MSLYINFRAMFHLKYKAAKWETAWNSSEQLYLHWVTTRLILKGQVLLMEEIQEESGGDSHPCVCVCVPSSDSEEGDKADLHCLHMWECVWVWFADDTANLQGHTLSNSVLTRSLLGHSCPTTAASCRPARCQTEIFLFHKKQNHKKLNIKKVIRLITLYTSARTRPARITHAHSTSKNQNKDVAVPTSFGSHFYSRERI